MTPLNRMWFQLTDRAGWPPPPPPSLAHGSARLWDRICLVCEQAFSTTSAAQNTCSAFCAAKRNRQRERRPTITKTCPRCQDQFEIPPWANAKRINCWECSYFVRNKTAAARHCHSCGTPMMGPRRHVCLICRNIIRSTRARKHRVRKLACLQVYRELTGDNANRGQRFTNGVYAAFHELNILPPPMEEFDDL